MAHYGEASKRLVEWIQSDPQRMNDFFSISEGHTTVLSYLAHYAYRQDIFREVINTLVEIEKNRVTKRVIQVE